MKLRFLLTSRITTSARFAAQSDALRQWLPVSKRVNGALWSLSNAVANKEYIQRLKLAIEHLHNCRAAWIASGPVKEVFEGRTIWEGNVETFSLIGHPKAKRAFGWSHKDGPKDADERFVTVLALPPVDSPQTAVKVRIMSEVRDAKGKK